MMTHLRKHERIRQIWLLGFLTVFLLGACAPQEDMEVDDAWANPALQGGNGGVYFVLRNHSGNADELVSISSEIAENIEIHESVMNGDVMQMHQLESVALPAGSEVAFGPGGYHVMLVGLKRDLAAGDEFDVTLHFRDFEDIAVRVTIR